MLNPPPVLIRPIKPEDWMPFEQLDKELFPEDRVEKPQFERMISTEGFFALESDSGKLIGCLYFTRFGDDEAHLGRIGVAKAEQNQGFGHKLMQFAIKKIRALGGIKKIHLFTQDFNLVAQHLYKKSGFKIVGTTWHYFVPYSSLKPSGKYTCQPIVPKEYEIINRKYGTSMPTSQIQRWIERKQLVLTLKTKTGNIVGACRFTPSFPGCFPLELDSIDALDDFLEGIRAYALPEFNYIRTTFIDNPALAKMLQQRRCKLHHRLYKMTLALY